MRSRAGEEMYRAHSGSIHCCSAFHSPKWVLPTSPTPGGDRHLPWQGTQQCFQGARLWPVPGTEPQHPRSCKCLRQREHGSMQRLGSPLLPAPESALPGEGLKGHRFPHVRDHEPRSPLRGTSVDDTLVPISSTTGVFIPHSGSLRHKVWSAYPS